MNGHPLGVLSQVPGVRMVGTPPEACARVHTDTRSLQAQDCFVALRGERFDAHQFLPQLRDLGVSCAVAEHGLAALGLSGAEVDDSRQALGDWASLWRAQLDLPLIAVTGSNGKTTVTQMVAAILRAATGDAALATHGNFNNDIGVPLTLLRLRPEHRIAVVELGMNHPGEIAGLARMAQAQVALVNNAQREHQEFMGSVAAVARENAAVFDALPPTGTAIFPLHSPFADLWRSLACAAHPTRRCWTFALNDARAELWAEAQWQGAAWALQLHSPMGHIDTSLAMAGEHNVLNALAAAACALASNVAPEAVAQGLRDFEAVSGRSRLLQVKREGGPLTLIDDSYNANPDSVLAAIAVLQGLPGPRALVLGDMGEVGQQGLMFHQEVLQAALAADIALIDVCGDWMRQAVTSGTPQTRLRHWDSVEALVATAAQRYASCRSVLIKGSRFMRMERVVQALTDTKGQVHAA